MSIEKGTLYHKQGKLAQAEEEYLNVLDQDFENSKALYFLGTLYLQRRKPGIAAQLLTRTLTLKPDFFEAWNNLGNCYKSANKDTEAGACWEKALAIPGKQDHEYADILSNIGTLYINSGEPEKGLPYFNRAVELNPEQADAHWNRSLANLELGKYEEGFSEYKWGFNTKNRMVRNYGDKIVEWDGSPDRKIIVWGEQGIGDEILFSSMIPDLMKISKQVIFECHERLEGIYKESFPGCVVYGTRKHDFIGWLDDHKDATHKLSIGDLGRYFRKSLKDFPDHKGYLKANPELVEKYKKKLDRVSGNKLKVGISWEGGYVKTRKDYRSIPLDKWKPILKQNCEFYSLQYTPNAYMQVEEVNDRQDVDIKHWPYAVQNDDYHHTAAFVSALDLVITVNTAIHHIAGALGKECWTLTPKGKAWRYYSPAISQRTIPWYPSVRQWQQKENGEWDGLLDKVAEELSGRVK